MLVPKEIGHILRRSFASAFMTILVFSRVCVVCDSVLTAHSNTVEVFLATMRVIIWYNFCSYH